MNPNVPLSDKMRELMTAKVNNLQDFIRVWDAIFTEMLGADFAPFAKRLVGEQQLSAPDIYDTSLMAHSVSSSLAHHSFSNGATVMGAVYMCYSELMGLVIKEKVKPLEALHLCTDWWGGFRTIPQKTYMARLVNAFCGLGIQLVLHLTDLIIRKTLRFRKT